MERNDPLLTRPLLETVTPVVHGLRRDARSPSDLAIRKIRICRKSSDDFGALKGVRAIRSRSVRSHTFGAPAIRIHWVSRLDVRMRSQKGEICFQPFEERLLTLGRINPSTLIGVTLPIEARLNVIPRRRRTTRLQFVLQQGDTTVHLAVVVPLARVTEQRPHLAEAVPRFNFLQSLRKRCRPRIRTNNSRTDGGGDFLHTPNSRSTPSRVTAKRCWVPSSSTQ